MVFKSASAVGNEQLGKELGDSDDENIDPDAASDAPSESLSTQPGSTKIRKSTRENLVKIYGLTNVSPRMVAYSAVAVCHPLSFCLSVSYIFYGI